MPGEILAGMIESRCRQRDREQTERHACCAVEWRIKSGKTTEIRAARLRGNLD